MDLYDRSSAPAVCVVPSPHIGICHFLWPQIDRHQVLCGEGDMAPALGLYLPHMVACYCFRVAEVDSWSRVGTGETVSHMYCSVYACSDI
jgi:hypothetical protein